LGERIVEQHHLEVAHLILLVDQPDVLADPAFLLGDPFLLPLDADVERLNFQVGLLDLFFGSLNVEPELRDLIFDNGELVTQAAGFFLFSGNFLFAAIIIIGALVIIIHDDREPMRVDFSITDEGLIVGKRFYDYDEIKDFAIVYKPHQEVKNLYFEFKSILKPRLSIPLNNLNPLPIRENLLRYLPEDLERTDQPVSEALAKMFKL